MQDAPRPPTVTTIDVTLDGQVLAPPSLWTRLSRLWRALPRGSVPLLAVSVLAVLAAAVLVLGILLVAVPVLLVLALVSALGRGRRPPVR